MMARQYQKLFNAQLMHCIHDLAGQLHKVFEDSFDAKKCMSKDFIYQKLDYIHHNPTSGKWMLAKDYLSYAHSSALFYEESVCIELYHFLN